VERIFHFESEALSRGRDIFTPSWIMADHSVVLPLHQVGSWGCTSAFPANLALTDNSFSLSITHHQLPAWLIECSGVSFQMIIKPVTGKWRFFTLGKSVTHIEQSQ